MKTPKTKYKRLRNIQLFWGLFIGIGAYLGAFMMICEPSGELFGMAPMLPSFQKLPFAEILFQDFIIPGIALLIINGLSNTLSLILIFRRNKYAALSGMICGIILMLWIGMQFYIFPLNVVSTLYFVFGILQAVNGWIYKIKLNSAIVDENIDGSGK